MKLNRRSAFAGAVAALAVGVSCFGNVARLRASDHIDSPAVAQDRGADIADVWAFLDPNDNSQVVLIASTQGFIVSGEHFGMVIFDPTIRYRFEIENTGDAKPDLFLDVTYSPGVGRLTAQTASVTLSKNSNGSGHGDGSDKDKDRGEGHGDRPIVDFDAVTTIATQEPQPVPPPAPVVSVDPRTGVKFFAGAADDPFFLDDTGANRFVASSLAHPGNPDKSLLGFRQGRDTYAGFNTLITAVSVPARLLRGTSSAIGVNFVTQRHQTQQIRDGAVRGGGGNWVNVDRQGNPLVNNGLISAALKDAYNGDSTENDARGKYVATLTRSLQNFGTDQAHIAAILEVIQKKGDILRLDLGVANTGPQGGTNASGGFGHMGGRRLTDDVVDAVFTLINNGQPLTDFVNGNEVPFRNDFPFVADPTQPFPPGQNPDDHTRQ